MADSPRTRVTRPRKTSSVGDACLVRIYPPGDDLGRKIEIKDDVSIGRDAANAIVIDKDSVSRRHARLVQRRGQTVVVDLESTNGTFVNDVAVKEQELRSGDLIRVGDTIFKFLHGSIESLYHDEIYRLTIVDGLTEAHNKRHLIEHLEREVARCRRHRRPLVLLMFDIDYFKRINDTHGHLAGDLVLRELGRLIRGRIRGEDLFARYGGEEFALVMPETTPEAALQAAEALRRLAADHVFQADGTRI